MTTTDSVFHRAVSARRGSMGNGVDSRADSDNVSAAAALSTAAHTAYHIGAIRQILAGLS